MKYEVWYQQGHMKLGERHPDRPNRIIDLGTVSIRDLSITYDTSCKHVNQVITPCVFEVAWSLNTHTLGVQMILNLLKSGES